MASNQGCSGNSAYSTKLAYILPFATHLENESSTLLAPLAGDGVDTPNESDKRVRMIPVPVSVDESGPVDVWKEVYQYPVNFVTTVIEKQSYMSSQASNEHLSDGSSHEAKFSNKYSRSPKNRHGCRRRKNNSSFMVSGGKLPCSVSPVELSNAMSWEQRNASQGGSSNSSTFSLNITRSSSGSSLLLAKQDLLQSDTASDVSNVSDLSSYESEYIRIRQLISDSPGSLISLGDLNCRPTKTWPTIAEIHDYDSAVNDLTTQKEDLEIQVHRLGAQLHNVIKEKDSYQVELEKIKTEVKEHNDRALFELMKNKADLEGKLDVETRKNIDAISQLESCKETLLESEIEKDLYISKCNEITEKEKELLLQIDALTLQVNSSSAMMLETKSMSKDLISKNRELELLLVEKTTKSIQFEEEIDKLARTVSDKDQELMTLNTIVDRLHQQNRNFLLEKMTLVSEKDKLSSELESVTKWHSWLKEQLKNAEDSRTTLQEQLKELREGSIQVTAERNALKDELQAAKHEMQEGRSKSVRERNTLLLKLETLQTDLVRYENDIQKCKNPENLSNPEDTMQHDYEKLQKDNKKMRLQLLDLDRFIENLNEKIDHRNEKITRNEVELKKLRQEAVMHSELIVEKDIREDALINQVNERNVTIANMKKELTATENSLKTLREDKFKVDVKLTGIISEKLEVDQATTKVKEDINKLSSSLFRMKHDLTARDREIQRLTNALRSTEQERDSATDNLTQLTEKILTSDGVSKTTTIATNINLPPLKGESRNESFIIEHADLKKNYSTLECQIKSMSEAVHVRDQQIENIQNTLATYREMMEKKDNDLRLFKKRINDLENTSSNLETATEEQKHLISKLENNMQEKTFAEDAAKKELSSLRESLHKEHKLKKAIDKKIELNNIQFGKEREKLKAEISSREKKFLQLASDHEAVNKQLANSRMTIEQQLSTVKASEKLLNKIIELDLVNATQNHSRNTSSLTINNNIHDSKKTDCELQSCSSEKIQKERFDVITILEELNIKLSQKNLIFKSQQEEITTAKEQHSLLKRELNQLGNKLDEQNRIISKLEADSLTANVEKMNSITSLNAALLCKEEALAAKNNADMSLAEREACLVSVSAERDKWRSECQCLQDYVDTIPQRDTGPSSVRDEGTVHTKEPLETTESIVTSHQQSLSSRLAEVLSEKEHQLENLTAQLESQANIVHKLKEEHLSTKDLLRSEIHMKEAAEHALSSERLISMKFSDEVDRLNKHVQNNDDRSRDMMINNKKLENECFLTNEKCNKMESDLKILNQQLTEKEDLFSETSSRLEGLQKILSDQELVMKNLNSTTEQLEFTVSELTQHKSELTTRNYELTKQVCELTATRDDLSSRVADHETQSELLSCQLRESREQQRRYESNVNLLTRKLGEHMKVRKEAEKEVVTWQLRAAQRDEHANNKAKELMDR